MYQILNGLEQQKVDYVAFKNILSAAETQLNAKFTLSQAQLVYHPFTVQCYMITYIADDARLGNSNKTHKEALDDITQARGRLRVGSSTRHHTSNV
jgi:hypothetical protein